jgi:poly-beta-hydroxybutyrate-responsive repressor
MTEPSPNGAGSTDARSRPRNWLQPFLLLCLEQWQSYGYELMQRLAVFGFEAVDPGSVYRTLRQLEREGLVRSDWSTRSEGPARRIYSMTDAGRDYLSGWAVALRGYQTMLDRFFAQYSAAPHPMPPIDETRD